MSRPITITENAQLIITENTNWEGERMFDLMMNGEKVGTIYRATHTTPIMAKNANYSIGSRKRTGWEWRIDRNVGVKAGILTSMFRRSTSYTLFTSKVKAAADLVELITKRTSA